MNTDTIEAPERAITEVKPATLKETALASFVPIEKHLRALAGRYADVAFDVATPRGFNAAKLARQELREDGRYAVQRLEKRLRDEANDLKRTVADEAERLIAIVQPVEQSVQAQIDVEEARREAVAEAKRQAAAEAARIEAERVQRHRDNIATIRLYLAKAQGLPSERILKGMEMLAAIDLSGFEDFAADALVAHTETAQAMTALYNTTLAREREAARIEAQRIEQERIAAEQKAEAERLAAQRAEIERQAAELAAQQEEDALVSSILANSRRIEADSPDYIRKASTYFESAAKYWENDPRERVSEAVAEGRLYLQSRLADALQRQADQKIRDAGVAAAEGMIRAASPVDPATGEILTPAQEFNAMAEPTGKGMAVTPGAGNAEAAPITTNSEPAADPLTLSAIGLKLGFPLTQAFLAKIGVQPTAKVKTSVFYDAALWLQIKTALIRHVEGLA